MGLRRGIEEWGGLWGRGVIGGYAGYAGYEFVYLGLRVRGRERKGVPT